MVVSSKRIYCAICNKKCTQFVLRYQDQYYHKQCFELDQRSQDHHRQASSALNLAEAAATNNNNNSSSTLPRQANHRLNYSNNNVNNLEDSSSLNSRQQQFANNNQQQNTNQSMRTIAVNKNQTSTVANNNRLQATTSCAGCRNPIKDGQALVALDSHWHIWCFKCNSCQIALHGEYVAKDGLAYCEKDYQKLFGVVCVYCKRYITGKVLQAGEAHHFHPSCARCSKCGDPFVPGEEMYLQGEVTWHPRCGPNPADQVDGSETLINADSSSRSQLRSSQHAPTTRARSPSLSSRSRSVSPFSYMSRQYGRSSPGYADSEAVGDLSRIYTISYLNADPTQGYLRRPIEPNPPKSPQFSRPTSAIRSRSSSRSHQYNNTGTSSSGGFNRERSIPRGMYSVLSSMRGGGGGSSIRARSPSMMNEEAIHLAQYPSGQKPSPDTVPKIERDDFPAPPFPYPASGGRRSGGGGGQKNLQPGDDDIDDQQLEGSEAKQTKTTIKQQQRASRPRSREIVIDGDDDDDESNDDPQLKKEEKELSKIANGIGKIFLQTLKEREKLRAWKRANLDPRNASRTPSATRELPSRLRYDNPTNASPSRDMDRPRPWEEENYCETSNSNYLEHSPTRTRSSLYGRSNLNVQHQQQPQMSPSTYGYKVIQSNRSTPKPGYGLSSNGLISSTTNVNYDQTPYTLPSSESTMSFAQHQRSTQNRSTDLLNRTLPTGASLSNNQQKSRTIGGITATAAAAPSAASSQIAFNSPHLRRSMPNVNNLHHLHQEGPPKLYPYHLLATSNYRLPPGVDRCHLERHLSNEEFQYIFHCDRLDFYRLPEWKRNELKRRAKLF